MVMKNGILNYNLNGSNMTTLKQRKAAYFKLLSPAQQASGLAWDATTAAEFKDTPNNHKVAYMLHSKAVNANSGEVSAKHKECATRHLVAQFGIKKFVRP